MVRYGISSTIFCKIAYTHFFFVFQTLTLDGCIERTKERPLARGDITPVQAFSFLGLQLTAGLAVLLQLNWYRYVTAFVGAAVWAVG